MSQSLSPKTSFIDEDEEPTPCATSIRGLFRFCVQLRTLLVQTKIHGSATSYGYNGDRKHKKGTTLRPKAPRSTLTKMMACSSKMPETQSGKRQQDAGLYDRQRRMRGAVASA